MEEFNLYKDISARTKGEIFLGVVGPVRTENPPSSAALWNSWYSADGGK